MRGLRVSAAIAAFGAAAAVCSVAEAGQIFDPTLITLRHDFETDPPSAPPPGPFTLGSVTFSETSSGTGGPGWRLISVWPGFGRQLTDNAAISDILLEFDEPMLRAGFDVGIGDATFTVEFYNGGDLLGSVTDSVVGVDGHFFAGWEDAGGITSIRIIEPSGENGRVGGIDNVRYDYIPAPGALALIGIAGLGLRRRRRA